MNLRWGCGRAAVLGLATGCRPVNAGASADAALPFGPDAVADAPGSVATRARTRRSQRPERAEQFAVDATNVYWTNHGIDGRLGQVMKAPKPAM